MQTGEFLSFASILVAASAVFIASLTFIRTQKWQQLRFAVEVVEKVYSDENLWLAIRFLDWHDREIILPPRYAQYGDAEGRFSHKIDNMNVAMSAANREHEVTGVIDLKKEYRLPQYMIYVEVFDQFFDYLAELQRFVEAGLLRDNDITPIVYFIRRLNALGLFRGYLNVYEMKDVLRLVDRFSTSSDAWVRQTAQYPANH